MDMQMDKIRMAHFSDQTFVAGGQKKMKKIRNYSDR